MTHTSRSGLFGLDHSNHDFQSDKSFGKNIFTNAFPISLGQYMHLERKLEPIQIEAVVNARGDVTTQKRPISWAEVLDLDPAEAHFEFEHIYSGYEPYTHGGNPNKSDVVVMTKDGQHRRPLEIKLVVVPTSQTAHRVREEQSCELVVRPPTVEQLAFSISHTYGQHRRNVLQDLIVDALGKPLDFQWENENEMLRRLPKIIQAAENISRSGISIQTPLVLLAIWRSQGQQPILDEHAFDLFVWTDLGFLQLFIEAARTQIEGKRKMGRPARALIWLIYSLWEYSAQNSLRFSNAHSKITYGAQTDKAGSFANRPIHRHLIGPEFLYPRIKDRELYGIINEASLTRLAPERRLDAALAIQHLLNVKNSD